MRRSLRLLIPVLLAALPACGAGVSLTPDAQGPGGTLALVRLTTTRTQPDGSPQVTADARFLRFTGVPAPTAATLSGVIDPEAVALGTCALVDPAGSIDAALAAPTAGGIDLALLDAGTLSFRIGGALALDLSAQHAPDLVPFLSGVEYGNTVSAEALAPGMLDGANVSFGASGGPDLGPFGTQAELPPEIRMTLVNGVDPAVTPVQLAATAPLDVRWQPDPLAGPTDAVDVELRAAPEAAAGLVCHVADSGSMQIPGGVPSPVEGDRDGHPVVWIAVLRTRTLSLALPGFGGASSRLVLESRDGTLANVAP